MVPFFFAKKMPEGSTFVPDECVYNNMGDSPRCREIDPARVKLFHFTVCQKPWCVPRRSLLSLSQEHNAPEALGPTQPSISRKHH
jgi:hypothetical protein